MGLVAQQVLFACLMCSPRRLRPSGEANAGISERQMGECLKVALYMDPRSCLACPQETLLEVEGDNWIEERNYLGLDKEERGVNDSWTATLCLLESCIDPEGLRMALLL